jgi:hypothetical protein
MASGLDIKEAEGNDTKRKIEEILVPFPDSPNHYNTNRHCEYSPFWYIAASQTLQIEKRWAHEILKFDHENAKLELIDDVIIPHENQSHLPIIKDIMRFVCSRYRYHTVYKWITDKHVLSAAHFPKPLDICDLEAKDVKEIEQLSRISFQRPLEPADIALDNFSLSFPASIDRALTTHKSKGIFLKTTFKSCKNDFPLMPIESIVHALLTIAESRDMVVDLLACPKLVMLPWNSEISAVNEVRVICNNHQTVAIAPQNYRVYAEHHILKTEKESVSKLITLCDTIANDFYYPDLVLDVYYDETEKLWKLIEINPGGAWSGSGSSCFHWITDGLCGKQRDQVQMKLFTASKISVVEE